MSKGTTKWALAVTLLTSTMLLASCGEKEPEKNALEIQLEQNIASVPIRDQQTAEKIELSRGTPAVDQEGNPTGELVGTLSKGVNRELELSVLTRDQLKALSKEEHLDIYVNGVIRDEFYVAANILYGTEVVAQQKEAFKEALLTPLGGDKEGRIVDSLGLGSTMRNPDVVHHYVDDVITHLNHVYIRPSVAEDFDNRIVIKGETYPIKVQENLNSVERNATEFVALESDNIFNRSEADQEKLTAYYQESFLSALTSAVHATSTYTETLGGFEVNEDGLWLPTDMHRLAQAVIQLTLMK